MASIGTALGAQAASTSGLLTWPPSEEALRKHGGVGLTALSALALAVMKYTLTVKEESHTPAILKVKSRADVLKERSEGTSTIAAKELPAQAESVPAAEETADDSDWRETELEKRTARLLHVSAIVAKELKEEGKTSVRFQEIFEAASDVRQLDAQHPQLGEGFRLAAIVLSDELVFATKLTVEGKSRLHKTGEDVADLTARYSTMHAMCRGLALTPEGYTKLWAQMNKLWWISWRSQLILWRMRIPDAVKACKVVLLARKHIPHMLFASGLKVSQNAIQALVTLFKAEAVETLRMQGIRSTDIRRKVYAVLILTSVDVLLRVAGDRINTVATFHLFHKLRTAIYSSMLSQDLEWYRLGQPDQRDIHGLFKEIFELPGKATLFVNAVLRTFEASSSLFFTGTLILQRSTGLLFTLVVTGLAQNFGLTLLEILQQVFEAVVTRTNTKVERNWVEPILPENIQTIRACTAEARVLQNWNMYWRAEHRSQNLKHFVGSLRTSAAAVIYSATRRIEMGTAGRLVLDGKVPYSADVQTITGLVLQQSNNIFQAAWAVLKIKEVIPPLARAYELITLEPNIGLQDGLVPSHSRAAGKLEFHDVSFSYPGTAKVLSSVNFTVLPCRTLGITGSSGAGKSTLLLLLQRLYDPQEGQVLLDGVDIKTLNPIWLRRQISVVSQRPRIFHMSLLKNLTYGCEIEPSEQEVHRACCAARLDELVYRNPMRFPLGVHTIVMNETLSGGELQRLAIARALLKDSPILLLDEATSALDSESQSLVKEGLNTLMEGRTTVIIAHRLETVKDSDCILVVDGGCVKESGKHEELVQAGGLYSRLYREQIESTVSK